MERENIKEYGFVRDETEFIRDCITTYMGYAISGSGAALFGLAALKFSEGEPRIPTALIAFTLALILSLVLAILIYKFNSHNRYVGYARIITDEVYKTTKGTPSNHDGAHTAWEICMERLRMIQGDANEFITLCNAATIAWSRPTDAKKGIDWMVNSYIGGRMEPLLDRHRTSRGIWQLCLALFGKTKTTSWAFPPYVVAVFFVLVAIYLVIAIYCVATLTFERSSGIYENHKLIVLQAYSVFVITVLLFLWRAFCRKLCLLMIGSLTVDSYSFKFLIVRAAFLNDRGISPAYPSFELMMKDEAKNLPAEKYEHPSHDA